MTRTNLRSPSRTAIGMKGEDRHCPSNSRTVTTPPADSLRLGTFTINNPVVALSTATKGSTADSSYTGVIGAGILNQAWISARARPCSSQRLRDELFHGDLEFVGLFFPDQRS